MRAQTTASGSDAFRHLAGIAASAVRDDRTAALCRLSLAAACLLAAATASPAKPAAQEFPIPGIECVPSPYGCPGEGGGSVEPGESVEEYSPPPAEGPSPGERAAILNNQSRALYLRGDYAGTVRALRQALALDPGNRIIRGNLALAEGVWLSIRKAMPAPWRNTAKP
jgi:hypothetical protein